MNIQGLQKLTLLDFPGKVACTIFIGGCNFRCPFCHNASLVLSSEEIEKIEKKDILKFLKKRKTILEGVCITGGEPLMQSEIELFIAEIKSLGYLIKLDTNGSYPKQLKSLVGKNLIDYVAMDIKNGPSNYSKTIGLKEYDITKIKESVTFLLSGTIPYEFRTTIVSQFHKPEDMEEISDWITGAENYYLQTFVDSGDLIGKGLTGYGKEEMEIARNIAAKKIENAAIRGM